MRREGDDRFGHLAFFLGAYVLCEEGQIIDSEYSS